MDGWMDLAGKKEDGNFFIFRLIKNVLFVCFWNEKTIFAFRLSLVFALFGAVVSMDCCCGYRLTAGVYRRREELNRRPWWEGGRSSMEYFDGGGSRRGGGGGLVPSVYW